MWCKFSWQSQVPLRWRGLGWCMGFEVQAKTTQLRTQRCSCLLLLWLWLYTVLKLIQPIRYFHSPWKWKSLIVGQRLLIAWRCYRQCWIGSWWGTMKGPQKTAWTGTFLLKLWLCTTDFPAAQPTNFQSHPGRDLWLSRWKMSPTVPCFVDSLYSRPCSLSHNYQSFKYLQ